MHPGSTPEASGSIWFCSPFESDPATLASDSAILRRVCRPGLQPSIEVAAGLMHLLEDPDFSVATVASEIERDPAMATRVLRAANSSMFTLRQPCKAVRHAVTLLGARSVGELAAAAAAAELFGRYGVQAKLRDHAVACAVVARELAQLLCMDTEDVFLAGLLHDVGKLVLLQGAGEERYGIESLDYASLLERRVGTCGGVHLMEQAALGFDHAALGCAALRAWNIPEPIPQLVGWHHSVPRARQEGGRMAELVYLLRVADCLTHAFTGPRLDDEANQAATREPAAMAGLGLNAERLEAFIPQLQYAHAAAPGLLD